MPKADVGIQFEAQPRSDNARKHFDLRGLISRIADP